MDTTSSALSRILLLLSMNPSVQDKLREEIVAARKEAGGDLDYYHWPFVRTNRRSDSAQNTPNSLSFLPVQVLINHVKSSLDHLRSCLSTIMAVGGRMGREVFRTLWRDRLSDRRSHPPIDDLSLKQSTTKLHGHVATVGSIMCAKFRSKKPYAA